MLIAGNATLTKSLFLVKTTNGNFIAIDGETIIKKSVPTETDANVNTGAAGATAVATFRLTLPRVTLAADVYALLRWQVTAAGGAASTGRIRLDLQKEGGAIAGVTVANGTTRALDAIAGPFDEVLHVRLPSTDFAASDRLDFVVDVEVVNAVAGAATVRLRHDPATSGSEAIAEVNV